VFVPYREFVEYQDLVYNVRQISYEISGSHGGEYEDDGLLGYCAA
jgi:hypothetical protein